MYHYILVNHRYIIRFILGTIKTTKVKIFLNIVYADTTFFDGAHMFLTKGLNKLK